MAKNEVARRPFSIPCAEHSTQPAWHGADTSLPCWLVGYQLIGPGAGECDREQPPGITTPSKPAVLTWS